MEEPSEGEGRRDGNRPVTSVLLAQPSLTSGRTGGGRGGGGRRHIATYLAGVPVLRLQAPPPSCHEPSGVFTTPLKKKKKATRFSPGLLQSQLQWREKEEEEPGTGGERAGGRARAGEVQGHVTGSGPPPHHVGDPPRPNPQ